MSRTRASFSQLNSENEIKIDNLSQKSECPLCFRLYPTPDIEVICNIKFKFKNTYF